MRADLGFVGLDNAIERGGLDITLLNQDRLERTHPKLYVGQLRPMFVIVIVGDMDGI